MKILLFGYGNPGRGDDGLGPELVSRIAQTDLAGVECQNDMQLQVEHVTDLQGCDRVMFIDADMSCAKPFEFSEIGAAKDCQLHQPRDEPVSLAARLSPGLSQGCASCLFVAHTRLRFRAGRSFK